MALSAPSLSSPSYSSTLCPYCKGQSPTCVECDYGGYGYSDVYKRRYRKPLSPVVSNAPGSRPLPSSRDQWLHDKLIVDRKRLVQIFQQPFSRRDYRLVTSIWLFWKKQSDLPQGVLMSRQLTELLELVDQHIQTNRKQKSIS